MRQGLKTAFSRVVVVPFSRVARAAAERASRLLALGAASRAEQEEAAVAQA